MIFVLPCKPFFFVDLDGEAVVGFEINSEADVAPRGGTWSTVEPDRSLGSGVKHSKSDRVVLEIPGITVGYAGVEAGRACHDGALVRESDLEWYRFEWQQ